MKYIYTALLLFLSVGLFYGCLEDPDMPDEVINASIPVIADYSIDGVKAESLQVTAKITKHNGSKVTKQGYYYYVTASGKTSKSAIEVWGTTEDNGIISFDTIIGGLLPNTEYTVVAFAINAKGEREVEVGTRVTAEGLGNVATIKPNKDNIKGTSALVSGNIINAGEGDILERGIYYWPKDNSSLLKSSFITEDQNPYTCKLDSLNTETKYCVQAYVKNTFGIFKGNIDSLETKDGKPLLSTLALISSGYTEARLKSSVTNEGDSAVTKRGICWSKTQTPLPEIGGAGVDTVVVGNGVGEFLAELTGLQPATAYYARAYATNAFGTTYSELKNFATFSIKPIVETIDFVLDAGTVTMQGNVVSQGLNSIIAAGFCWGTGAEPTIDNDTVISSTGVGEYTGLIKTLKGGTKYYIRAYATNSEGTSYGKALEVTPPAIFSSISVNFPEGNYTPNTNTYFTIENRNAYILCGDIGPDFTDKLWNYNSVSGLQEKVSFDYAKRKWQTAVNVGNIAYVLGGIDHAGNLTDDYHSYWPLNNVWKVEPKGPSARYSSVGASIGNTAFFVGGNLGATATKEVWSYDNLTAPAWKQLTDIPVAQYGGVAVVARNEDSNYAIYTGLGNESGGGFNNAFWSSSDRGVTWDSETSFPESVGAVRGGVVLNGMIYVLDDTGTIWQYNPTEKEWTKKSKVTAISQYFHCMFMLEDRDENNVYKGSYIYIGLGENSNRLIKYDPIWDN